jgi:hypothetical protein
MAEGADDVENRVARLKAVEQRGGFAHGLHNDGDGSGGWIGALDGQGNAFAHLMHAQNDELPRALLARNPRRLNGELPDVEARGASFYDSEHILKTRPPIPLCRSDPAERIMQQKLASDRNIAWQADALSSISIDY